MNLCRFIIYLQRVKALSKTVILLQTGTLSTTQYIEQAISNVSHQYAIIRCVGNSTSRTVFLINLKIKRIFLIFEPKQKMQYYL